MIRCLPHLFLSFCLTVTSGLSCLCAQDLPELEQSMISAHRLVLSSPSEPERFAANEQFIHLLDEALAQDTRMRYGFDSLRTVSILSSDDGKFRVFSWYVQYQSGEYTYFGLIQSWNERSKRFESHWLTDRSPQILQPEEALLDADNWYGALYYDIVETGKSDRKYYTLLGWDGNDQVMRRKIIEVLTFRQSGSPVFGYNLFRNYNRKARRIIFEYSARSGMTLRYDRQAYHVKERNKRTRKTRLKEVQDDMIVFDRLVPLQPSLTGNREFYVPESNVFDALIWTGGHWDIVRDVDARNTDPEKPRQEPRTPADGLYPPVR